MFILLISFFPLLNFTDHEDSAFKLSLTFVVCPCFDKGLEVILTNRYTILKVWTKKILSILEIQFVIF